MGTNRKFACVVCFHVGLPVPDNHKIMHHPYSKVEAVIYKLAENGQHHREARRVTQVVLDW
jgi:hypothetical protein